MSKTILAVDDSPSVRQMVRLTLMGAGYTVVEAVDGQDALEKAGSQRFDAILTDQNMPRLDGIGFIRKLRTLPEGKGVPIVFLSTESQDTLTGVRPLDLHRQERCCLRMRPEKLPPQLTPPLVDGKLTPRAVLTYLLFSSAMMRSMMSR